MIRSMPSQTIRRALLGLVVALALVVAACTSDEQAETTTTTEVVEETTTTTADTSNDALVFGNGTIPETIPESFPIPEEAGIGATMIDRVNGVTEVIVIYPAHFEDVIDYYETNLPATGYTIDSSEGTEGQWTIAFSGEATGEVLTENAGSGVTQGIIRFTDQLEG